MAKGKNPAKKTNDDPDLDAETPETEPEEVVDVDETNEEEVDETTDDESDNSKRAESFIDSHGSPSRFHVNDGDPAFDYTWFNPSRMRPVQAEHKRNDLHARGFDPCNGPRKKGDPDPAHVPAAPDCELWKIPKKDSKKHFARRLEKALSSDEYRRSQAGRVKTGGFLEDAVRGTGVKIKTPSKIEKLAREARKARRSD